MPRPATTGSSDNTEGPVEKRRRGPDVKALEDRIKALEALLVSANQNTQSPIMSPSLPHSDTENRRTPPPSTDPVSRVVKPVDVSFLDHITGNSSCDALEAMMAGMKLKNPSWSDTPFTVPTTLSGMLGDVLSNRRMVMPHVLNLYFTHSSAFIPLNFLHRETFMRGVNDESPMLLLAIYSVVGRLSDDPQVQASVPVFFAKSRKLVAVNLEYPTMSGLQALLMLTYASSQQNRLSNAWNLLGMSIRMAQYLQLDHDPDELGSLTWVEKETRRRVWWSCVIMDRLLSSYFRRNVVITKKWDVKYPVPEALWELANSDGNLPASAVSPDLRFINYYEYFLKVFSLFSEAMEYANRAAIGTIQTAEANAQFSSLEGRLHDWFQSVPDVIRRVDQVDCFSSSIASVNPPPYFAAVVFLWYQSALCILHRPRMMTAITDHAKNGEDGGAGRAGSGSPRESLAQNRGEERSVVIAQQAANACVRVIERLMHDQGNLVRIGGLLSVVYLEASMILLVASRMAYEGGDEVTGDLLRSRITTILRFLKLASRWSAPATHIAWMIERTVARADGVEVPATEEWVGGGYHHLRSESASPETAHAQWDDRGDSEDATTRAIDALVWGEQPQPAQGGGAGGEGGIMMNEAKAQFYPPVQGEPQRGWNWY
ncbi:hypothetical protein HK104_006034 [Borealophlyctis nickersoniae]|nr:hypothetical protein HK104_006034 [Borealophlyctis nickersoniae]